MNKGIVTQVVLIASGIMCMVAFAKTDEPHLFTTGMVLFTASAVIHAISDDGELKK